MRPIIPGGHETPPQDAPSFAIGTGPANFPDVRRATGDEKLGHKLRKCRLESATRRHMQAINTLARVRKLQANTPGVQFNTQIKVR